MIDIFAALSVKIFKRFVYNEQLLIKVFLIEKLFLIFTEKHNII